MHAANGVSKPQTKIAISGGPMADRPDSVPSNGLNATPISNQISSNMLLDSKGASENSWIPTISPDNRFRQAWQIWMACPLLWTGTVMPYVLCFIEFRVTEDGLTNQTLNSLAWIALNVIVDASFWIDLVLTFFSQYQDPRGNVVTKPKLIVKGYLKGWFLFDLIACLPPEFFGLVMGSGSNSGVNKVTRLPRLYRVARLARLMRMTRILRVARVFRGNALFQMISEAIGQSRLASVAKFMVMLLSLAHLLGCIWYLIAALSEDPVKDSWLGRRSGLLSEAHFTHWVTSVYFVITVFTSVGFGDIYPMTDSEVVFGICLMMIGAVVHSIIVSEVIAVVTRVDGLNSEIRLKRQAVQSYGTAVNLRDSSLESRCVQFAEFSTRAKYADSRRRHKEFDWRILWEVLRDMPDDMKRTLHERAYEGVLVTNKLFDISRKLTKDDMAMGLWVSAHLKQALFEPWAKVYCYGDQPTGLFLILSGTLAYVAVPTERGGVADVKLLGEAIDEFEEFPYQLFGCRGYCGEWELIYPHPRVAACRAETRTFCLHLSQQSFIIMVSNFPKFLESFKPYARRRERLRVACFEKHKHGLAGEVFAITKIQSFLRGIMTRMRSRRSMSKLRSAARMAATTRVVATKMGAKKSNTKTASASSTTSDNVIVEDFSPRQEVPVEKKTESPAQRPRSMSNEKPLSDSDSSLVNGIPNGMRHSPSPKKTPIHRQQTSPKKPRPRGNSEDDTGVPQWALEMRSTVRTMEGGMDNLKKGQEEMERMVQQLYFLSFSNGEKPQNEQRQRTGH